MSSAGFRTRIGDARVRSKSKLARVIAGEDSAGERDQLRAALTMNKLCDLYLEAADAGLVLGRKGMPKKQRTIDSDRCRVGADIRPLIGHFRAAEVTLHSLATALPAWPRASGATIPTIAALLGQRLGGVIGGYILKLVDVLLIDAANRVADQIALQMRGEAPPSNIIAFQPRGRRTGPLAAMAA